MSKRKLSVCTKGKTCRHRGAKDIFAALKKEVEAEQVQDQIKLKKTGCQGYCKCGPVIKVKKAKLVLGHVTIEDCAAIVRSLTSGTVKTDATIERLRLRKKH